MSADITEFDLLAYVDGQLDAARRIAVEDYLAHHPDTAARVMADLRQRDEIRLFLEAGVEEERSVVVPATELLVRRLSRSLRRRSFWVGLRRVSTAVVFLAAGWLGHVHLGALLPNSAAAMPPLYVDEATDAYRAARMAGVPALAPGELAQLAHRVALVPDHDVPLPPMPGSWRLVGAHAVPWDGGVALQAVFHDPGNALISLFAAEDGSDGFDRPQALSAEAGLVLVHWRQGPAVYALAGELPASELLAVAQDFFAASGEGESEGGP